MSLGINVFWSLLKNGGPLIKNIVAVSQDVSLAANRTLIQDQNRRLATRYGLAPEVIDSLIEHELIVRQSPTHGFQIDVTEPMLGYWSGDRINGSMYVVVSNTWVRPGTLKKLAATIEVPGFRAHVDVTSTNRDVVISARTPRGIELSWSWLTTRTELQQFTIRDDRLSEIRLTVTPTASLSWDGTSFEVERPFSILALISPRPPSGDAR